MIYPKAIVYQNKAQFDALKLRINNRLRSEKAFKGCSDNFGAELQHPSTQHYAYIVDMECPEWVIVEAEITPNEINNVVSLDETWFPIVEI